MAGTSDSNVPTHQATFVGLPQLSRSASDNSPGRAPKCAGCVVRKCQATGR
jgi:hypothetical protein